MSSLSKMTDGYPFIFLMKDYQEANKDMLCCLQYRFKSTKTNHTYLVRVEQYRDNVYCLKFYDKSVSDSKNRYSLRTNTFEARTILYTIYRIMLDVYKKDLDASFFFIGAEDERDELGQATRRYRVYRQFVSTLVSNKIFAHFRSNELSLYMLINRKKTDIQKYAKKIEEEVRAAYGL